MTNNSSGQSITCEDCVHHYPEQIWITKCRFFAQEYGKPCELHETEKERRIKDLLQNMKDIKEELTDLGYDSSSTTKIEDDKT